jgi:hypothetical protein
LLVGAISHRWQVQFQGPAESCPRSVPQFKTLFEPLRGRGVSHAPDSQLNKQVRGGLKESELLEGGRPKDQEVAHSLPLRSKR